MTERLDVHLVRAGLARSRGEATQLVRSGAVTVNGGPARRASHPVEDDDAVEVERDGPAWVGRGAFKLEGALAGLGRDAPTVGGARCVDVGASTGGFTQVLIRRGAASVAAIDVGHGQLAPVVADDPRVTDHSGTTVRGLDPSAVGGPFDVLVADLSFVSLRTVAEDLAGLVRAGGHAIVLVKPQFEVGRERLGKNGLVRSASARRHAVLEAAHALAAAGLQPRRALPSPVVGTTGNREYLLWLTRTADLDPDVTGPAPTGASSALTWQALEMEIDRIVATEEG